MTSKKNLNYVSKEFTQPYVPKTYEQFFLEEQQTPSQGQDIADSYVAEFDAYSGIGTNKAYGPCPEQYYSDSSGNYVRITVTSEKKVSAYNKGYDSGYHVGSVLRRSGASWTGIYNPSPNRSLWVSDHEFREAINNRLVRYYDPPSNYDWEEKNAWNTGWDDGNDDGARGNDKYTSRDSSKV